MSSRVCVCCLLGLACSAEQVGPRAQRVVFIDTNAPLVGQLAANPDLPGAIAVDTLRIDRLDSTGEVLETREQVASDLRDWPISFGIVATETVRFRLRAFRGKNAAASEAGPLAPIRNLALDRLLEVRPSDGFERSLVVLDAECFNAPANFSGNWSSCVDAEHLAASPRSGIEPVDSAPETRAGTTLLARTRGCEGKAPSGALCIPGGAGKLGDEDAALLAMSLSEMPIPSRAIHLQPFFLDRTELTVGRYRAAAAAGKLDAEPPNVRGLENELYDLCTYLGPGVDSNDALPLTCVTHETARAVCRAAGGDLPTESQWEYAARGRGFSQIFPWGSALPECCTASIERRSLHGAHTHCPDSDAEPVGSHQRGSGSDCPTADESRDGVLDLSANVSEWTLDSYRAYDDACWALRGVLHDPHCEDPDANAHTLRGSYFNASFATAAVVIRSQGAPGPTIGFRCAYPAEASP